MALTVDYSSAPFLITVPKSDLTLIEGTKYQLDVDTYWLLLADYTDNEQTMSQPILYSRVPATATTPSITNINLDYYTIEFENGLYSVNIINGNTNIREAEEKNQVSVNTNNTAGFIDPTALELSLAEINTSVTEVWQLLGLDPNNPLVVSAIQQTVDLITLDITGTTTKTVQRS